MGQEAYHVGWSLGVSNANATRAGAPMNSSTLLAYATTLTPLDTETDERDFLEGYKKGIDNYTSCTQTAKDWRLEALTQSAPEKTLAFYRFAEAVENLCVATASTARGYLQNLTFHKSSKL